MAQPRTSQLAETLCEQIEPLAAGFGFDGVFLDTVHVWINDPDYPVYDGVRVPIQLLRERIPGVLPAAEHYDALLPLFPPFQRAYWGHDPEADPLRPSLRASVRGRAGGPDRCA